MSQITQTLKTNLLTLILAVQNGWHCHFIYCVCIDVNVVKQTIICKNDYLKVNGHLLTNAYVFTLKVSFLTETSVFLMSFLEQLLRVLHMYIHT
jgi:hypothetical protein